MAVVWEPPWAAAAASAVVAVAVGVTVWHRVPWVVVAGVVEMAVAGEVVVGGAEVAALRGLGEPTPAQPAVLWPGGQRAYLRPVTVWSILQAVLAHPTALCLAAQLPSPRMRIKSASNVI